MGSEPVLVGGLGACTVVGRHALATAAAVRATIDGFVEHPFMLDAAGEPMRVAIAPWLEPDLSVGERLAALVAPAIGEALQPLSQVGGEGPRLALALGLPGARPGLSSDVPPTLMRAIADAHPGTFTTGAAFPNGHAAGLLALAAGARQVARGASDACIVAGVDSYIAPETLEWLEERNLLHGGGLRKNPWGFLPGEGAGALLLARAGVFERLGLTAVSSLLGFGSAFEAKGARTQTVCIGEGLTAALRAALATLPKRARVTDLYCDMNGEPGRADEYGFATLRVSEAYDPDLQCETPVDCLGDTGAASGVLFAVLAAIAAAKGYSRGTTALIHCASETGERAAATLHTPTPEER